MRRLVIGGLVLVFLATALVTGAPRAVVDWRTVRAVAIQSDDWGLAGFVPRSDSWQGLEREAVSPGRFPPVYWGSTLEDAAVVDRLVAILAAHRGRDGVAAVFQPNYVMGSLAYDAQDAAWQSYKLPQWPPQYDRPGLWAAVGEGRRQGVWHPEFHALWHYDPEQRKQRGLATEVAREATLRGISLFPDSEKARELAPWRSTGVMSAELDDALRVFERVFGRRPSSVIAPDYTWHAWIEKLWQSRGLQIVQAKREQRNPQWLGGTSGRVQKYVDRQWTRLIHPGRTYLERNCRLEPVQSADPQAVVTQCVADTRRAWSRGEPAIVETHRVNFSHTDPQVVRVGMTSLAAYLSAVATEEAAPVFLCDTEIDQLARRGTSWRVAGERLVLRNGSRAGRVLAVPVRALAALGSTRQQPLLLRLTAGEVQVLQAADIP
jgi:hypothetical protein